MVLDKNHFLSILSSSLITAILYVHSIQTSSICGLWDGVDVQGKPMGGQIYCNFLGIETNPMSNALYVYLGIAFILTYILTLKFLTRTPKKKIKK